MSGFLTHLLVSQGFLMTGCYFMFNSDIWDRFSEPPAGSYFLFNSDIGDRFSEPSAGSYFMFNSDICVRIPEPPAGESGLHAACGDGAGRAQHWLLKFPV